MRKRYERIREQGIDFLFAQEPDDPDLLHIFARHVVTPEDVFEVWFDLDATEEWNAERTRFETSNATHVLYWMWRVPNESVFVITCYRRDNP